MKLIDLKRKKVATIKNINADKELKARLNSFGFVRGAKIKIVREAIKRSTIEVEIEGSLIALRDSEAKFIEVE